MEDFCFDLQVGHNCTYTNDGLLLVIPYNYWSPVLTLKKHKIVDSAGQGISSYCKQACVLL